MDVQVGPDDPRGADVRALLAIHLAISATSTPPEYSFALDVEQLVEPTVTFFSARRGGELLGVVALKRLDGLHAELKSMHTRESERGRGIGRAMVEHVLDFARAAGYARVYLETGSTADFAAARALYERCGFTPCPPYGHYAASPYNTFMTIGLVGR